MTCMANYTDRIVNCQWPRRALRQKLHKNVVLKVCNKPENIKYIEDITQWREDMNFIFEWQYLTHSLCSFVKYCFCHEKIKFISSSRRVMFFLLYRQKDIDKVIEGNDRNYVIDKLKCEIMENKPLGSRMLFL